MDKVDVVDEDLQETKSQMSEYTTSNFANKLCTMHEMSKKFNLIALECNCSLISLD